MRTIRLCALFALSLSVAASALERQASSDYRARREKLAAKLEAGVALVFAPPEAEGPNDIFGYRPDDNFYYLTGWPEPGAALLVAAARPAAGNQPARAYTEILFLPHRNLSQEQWTGPKLGPADPLARERIGIDRVAALDDLGRQLTELMPTRSALYTDVPAAGEVSNSKEPLAWLEETNAFPVGTSYHDIRPLLRSLRTVKDAGEIDLIRKATDASIAAQLAAIHAVRPGASEREISALLQYEWGRRGCERPAYAPIVGAGENSAVLHYSEDSSKIAAGDMVVMDAAGEYSLYASDITRSVPASGRFSTRQREIYDIVLGAQKAAIAAFASGKSHLGKGAEGSLYEAAYNYINSHGRDMHGEPLGKYFIHGLGHYVGLNVHDAGDYSAPLGPGVVFTIEPGIYIAEEKLGVRIEDMFYVDSGGRLVRLTQSLPQTAEEIESLMSRR